jgi:transposase
VTRPETDRRDCRRLARLHRAGELVAIRIPEPREEAVGDLCRARADLVDACSRARRRLQAFLRRHGRVYRAGACWTGKHQRWLGTQRFDDPQLQATFSHYRAVVASRDAQVTAIEADPAEAATQPPFAEAVARLGADRGVSQLGALSLAAQWLATGGASGMRARWWPSPGWCPVNAPPKDSVWRGHITRTGSKHLRFAAGGVRLVLPPPSPHRRRPCASASTTSAPTRWRGRGWRSCGCAAALRQLERRKHITGVAVVAVAGELAGFLWAEMQA